jgi:hypothetical protein
LTRRRWLFAGTITLAAALTAFWLFDAVIGWSVCCGWLIRPGFVIALSTGAALNVFGLLAFAIRGRSWGMPTLGAVQVGNILFALAAALVVSPAWLLFDAAPALVILILVVLLKRFEPQRSAHPWPPRRRRSTP